MAVAYRKTLSANRLVRRASRAVCLLPLLAGCGERPREAEAPPPKVAVAVPTARRLTHYLEATGSAAAVNTVDLVARVQGVLQEQSYVDGQTVSRGTTLFTIEPAPYQAQLRQSQAQQEGAEAQLAFSTAQYDRQLELARTRTASPSAVDQALAGRDGDRANVEQKRAATQAAAINYGYTRVAAPFDGIATAHLVSVGNLVGGNAKLASVVQLDPIHVNFSVSEQDAQRIRGRLARRGLTVQDLGAITVDVGLQTEQGYPRSGRLDYVQPGLDAATGTLSVRAVFDNKDHALLPGAFLRVRIPQERDVEALLVPDDALGTDQSGDYLLVVDAGNVVRQRQVVRGAVSGGLREIAGGIGPTDRVVVAGLQRAVPGRTVQPVEPASASGSGDQASLRP